MVLPLADKKGLRRLVALVAFSSFVIMTVTGVVIYFIPGCGKGRGAAESIIGLSGGDWRDMHIIASLLFALCGLLHVYLNWRSIVRYFKPLGSKLPSRAGSVTLIVTLVVIIAGINPFWPFDKLVNYGQGGGHGKGQGRELSSLTLSELAKQCGEDEEEIFRRLDEAGIEYDDASDSVEELAELNSTSERKIYKAATGEGGGRGQGHGRHGGR